MRVGVSLSPGGLLLPYHLGVLDSLEYNGFIKLETPIAGASAGAIAVASHGAGVDSKKVLESTIEISDRCRELGGARGRLLPLLKEKLDEFICDEKFHNLQSRPGAIGIGYRELFPANRPVLQSRFEDRQDLINAVCHSSTFPFFASNWPVAVCTAKKFPRVVIDGWFNVPRDRAGCPDFAHAGVEVDRTITVSVFPKELIGLKASADEDCISPPVESENHLWDLLRIATESSSREDLTTIYESGWKDAEDWFHADQKRAKAAEQKENVLQN
jgi:hypothetical protein